MIKAPAYNYERSIFYRITALWVICEAFAGGIMHGIKIPFSGMMVSSLAVFCIILMAWYIPSKTAILKATVIVAVFKLMLSPHSPPTAYIALFFQGLTGMLLLNKRVFRFSAMLLAFLSLVESAIQRILVLVIVYGNEFWQALNEFIKKVTGDKIISNYSFTLALLYLVIHAVVGLLVGYYSASFVQNAAEWQKKNPGYLIISEENEIIKPREGAKKKKIKIFFLLVWLLLLAGYIQSLLNPAQAILPSSKLVQILVRSVIIIISWYLLVTPLLMLGIKKLLHQQQHKNREHIAATMELLPETKMIFTKSWQLSKGRGGPGRLRLFLKIVVANVLARHQFSAAAAG